MTVPEKVVRVLDSGPVVHVWSPPSPRAVVVLQHGFAEYAERYVGQHANLVGRLLGRDMEVWAPDLWGHGLSPGRRGVVHVGRAVRDHLAVRRLARERGLPMLTIGHSLGGLVTAGSVAVDPAGLAGVVLLSPLLPRAEPAQVRRALGVAATLAPALPIPRRRQPFDQLSRIPAVGVRAAADPRMHDGRAGVLLAATALDVVAGVRALLRLWAMPTLVAHGTADTFTDPSASEELVAAVASPDRVLHLVDGGRHELLNDLGADDIARLVVDWCCERVWPT